MASGQRELVIQVSSHYRWAEGDEENASDDEIDTRIVLWEYVIRRFELDKNKSLNREEVQRAKEQLVQTSSSSALQKKSPNLVTAESYGQRLAEMGDQFDDMNAKELTDMAQHASATNSEKAFRFFCSVVRNVFELGRNRLPIFTPGRVAAVLGFCFRFCLCYVQKHANSANLVDFLKVVASYLVRFFVEAKFYDWLKRQGGWGNLLSQTIEAVGRRKKLVFLGGLGAVSVVVVAAAAVAVMVYFKTRK